jgi:hypothetical protein
MVSLNIRSMKRESRLNIGQAPAEVTSRPSVGATLSAPTVAITAVEVVPEYLRLPRQGQQDSIFGLTRSYLNLLILPSKENDFQPPVRSSVLRQGNAKSGVRLVNVASLKAYLGRQTASDNRGGNATVSNPTPLASVEFIRLPPPKGRDPLFGLSRSFLNELILPCPANGYKPPVQSHVLRRRGYRNGIRLISVDSLRRFIKAHEEPMATSGPSQATGPRIEQGDI